MVTPCALVTPQAPVAAAVEAKLFELVRGNSAPAALGGHFPEVEPSTASSTAPPSGLASDNESEDDEGREPAAAPGGGPGLRAPAGDASATQGEPGLSQRLASALRRAAADGADDGTAGACTDHCGGWRLVGARLAGLFRRAAEGLACSDYTSPRSVSSAALSTTYRSEPADESGSDGELAEELDGARWRLVGARLADVFRRASEEPDTDEDAAAPAALTPSMIDSPFFPRSRLTTSQDVLAGS